MERWEGGGEEVEGAVNQATKEKPKATAKTGV